MRGRLLVVDDFVPTTTTYRRFFERAGCSVDVAHCLRDARLLLARAEQQLACYDAIVLDLRLPDGDGAELMTLLGPQGARPVVLVLSGYLTSQRTVEFMRHDVQCLTKPAAAELIMEALDELLAAARPRDGARALAQENRLSPKESLLLALACDGKTDEEAALALGVAIGTVYSMWARIRKKTGHRGKREILLAAARRR